ncbi:hypothetical protein niasHS_004303 [Heterodera schachtii]|uniref:Protein kinase domain-containing protein n=1 Tax=Heterodera schachtii TaxID=97005 RepID=A0ABD2JUS7_HETSC
MASTSTAADEHYILGKCIKDKYVVLKQIGQGGFGRVYLCDNKNVRGQRYTLKMIPMPKGGRHHHSVNPKSKSTGCWRAARGCWPGQGLNPGTVPGREDQE